MISNQIKQILFLVWTFSVIITTTTTTTTTTSTIETTTATTTNATTTTNITTTFTNTTVTANTTGTTTTTTTTEPILSPIITTLSPNHYSRICYFSSKTKSRNGRGSFDITDNFQDDLCTHLIYKDAKVINNYDSTFPIIVDDISKTMRALRLKDRNIKILLGIGTYNKPTDGLPHPLKEIVGTRRKREIFIRDAARLLLRNGYAGLDITWIADDSSFYGYRFGFTSLCREMQSYFERRGLLASATVAGKSKNLDKSYEVLKVTEALDFINIQSFDFNPKNDVYAEHHSDTNPDGLTYEDNVLKSIHAWLKRGVDSRKLVMGISASGKSYTLQRADVWDIGSPLYGVGKPGVYTQQRGLLAYFEICRIKWIKHLCTYPSKAKAPFGTDGVDFISYDDPESVQYKVRNVMLKLNLKGFMISNLDLDDFDNICGFGHYPLVKAGRNAARFIDYLQFTCHNVPFIPTTTTTTTTTTTSTSTLAPKTSSEPVVTSVKTTTEKAPITKKTTTKDDITTTDSSSTDDGTIVTDVNTGSQGKSSQATREIAGYSVFMILSLHVFYRAVLL